MIEAKDNKLQEVRDFIAGTKQKDYPESYLIAVLHKVQELYGYLPQDVMDFVAEEMQVPTAHIWGVATFYHYFNLEPIGKHVVSVCMGTACYVKGADKVLDALKGDLGVEAGQTTEDGLFTLQEARCLGACGIAPVIMIDDKIYGELTAKSVVDLLNQYRKAESAGKK
ncbi:NADP-reducing hydrogenase subunit HndA [Anaerohalosphaera lusitana]|uniref:NADP-reducing hydrogenase subunit HndA n=1 Tax=Anaerohalosphaera lusitana TaxID=1936003 RepID=A0A1U9NKD8_9BACT|nr:NADH-quinone oxidoreductase subunit NuoE [Anaerohalosphaera lusitana]AQT68277.1 NADP-reducing hydrogenase subunit HndA [Anaerohalosphaera lusitana]